MRLSLDITDFEWSSNMQLDQIASGRAVVPLVRPYHSCFVAHESRTDDPVVREL
jgi:hypothetical protein